MTQHRPITRVVHDASDHGWQFLSDDGANMDDAMLVGLKEIVAHDNTVLEIADLPPGWIATRDQVGSPWMRGSQYADAARIVIDWSKKLATSMSSTMSSSIKANRPSGMVEISMLLLTHGLREE